MLFDNRGRCLTKFTKSAVHENSRYYFRLSEEKKNFSLKKIYENSKNAFLLDFQTSLEDFEKKIKIIIQSLKDKNDTKNLLNGFLVPFIYPRLLETDIGLNIKKIFLPSLERSYKNKFQNEGYKFINHFKEDLVNKIEINENSRYEKILKTSSDQEVIGLVSMSLNEFSFSAARDSLVVMPDNFVLSGGYEIISSIIGTPDLLFDKNKYPPLLWFSSLRYQKDKNIGFNIEPYGYNIFFNSRAHLDKVAEYWWHSITIL